MADDPAVADADESRPASQELSPGGLLREKRVPVVSVRRSRAARLVRVRRQNMALAALATLIVLLAGRAFLKAAVKTQSGRILAGVSIWGVPVGGMTPAAAEAELSRRVSAVLDRPVLLLEGRRSWSRSARALGCTFDLDAAVAAAAAFGTRGSLPRQALDRGIARYHGFDVKLRRQIDRDLLARRLRDVAAEAHLPAQNARIHFNGRSFAITPERSGWKIDAVETEKQIVRYFDPRVQRKLKLVARPDVPRITAAELRKIDTRLKPFTTHYNSGDANRTVNLRLAARSLDGTVVPAGEIFSYNQAVGPRLEERGYRVAKIFLKGEVLDGVGGGVCQLATTVYNAARESRLPIVERARHSRPVTYAPPGRDATVSFGSVDLKFRNSTGAPILIQARAAGGRLTVSLYGSRSYREKLDQAAAATRNSKSG